jgi:hypothetical protein
MWQNPGKIVKFIISKDKVKHQILVKLARWEGAYF